MKKFFQVLPLVLVLIFSLALPSLTFAQAVNNNVWDINILKGPLVTCVGAPASGQPGTTPCQSLCDLVGQVAHVIYFMIAVVIWILTPIFVAWAGIRFMLSRGNAEQTSKARKMITGIMIGLAITLCAYIIVFTFVSVFGLAQYVGGFGGAAACQIK
jgi:hypothetical protein